MTNNFIAESTLTCPECGHSKKEIMPTDSCQWFYECESCRALLKPKPGDCCVYCSYADAPCRQLSKTKFVVSVCFWPEEDIHYLANLA